MELRIAAVIPALDRHRLTSHSIATMRDSVPLGVDLRIMVVDDGSREPYRSAHCPGADIVRNETNLGYTAAVNRGISIALERYQPSAVALLNNDLEFRPGFFIRLLRAFAGFDIVGPFGRLPPAGSVQDAPFVEFSCALVNAEVFRSIGLLDPAYVCGYYSDDDFCLRARLARFKLGQLADHYPPDILHKSGLTYGPARRDRIRDSYPIFTGKWAAQPDILVQEYISQYLWNPGTRSFGALGHG